MKTEPGKRKLLLMWAIMLLLTWGLAEIIILAFNVVRPRRPLPFALTQHQRDTVQEIIDDKFAYVAFDPVTGWGIKPNGSSRGCVANSAGFRGREASLVPKAGTRRISTYGDSFTHGDEVTNEGTWQAHLERKIPRLEVLNFGVGGFGPDQALLRYRTLGRKYQSEYVFIGVLSENIARVVNRFRPFYRATERLVMTKPSFVERDGKLVLLENVTKRREDYRLLLDSPEAFFASVAKDDLWYQAQYEPWPFQFLPSMKLIRTRVTLSVPKLYADPAAVRLFFLVLKQHYEEAEKDGAIPVVVIFPGRDMRFFEGKPPLHQPLVDLLERNGLAYVDITEAFKERWREVAKPTNHYTSEENELVAKFLIEKLRLDRPRKVSGQ